MSTVSPPLSEERKKEIDEWVVSNLNMCFHRLHYFDPLDLEHVQWLLEEVEYFFEYIDKYQQDSFVYCIFHYTSLPEELSYIRHKVLNMCGYVMTPSQKSSFLINMQNLIVWSIENEQCELETWHTLLRMNIPVEIIYMILEYGPLVEKPFPISVFAYESRLLMDSLFGNFSIYSDLLETYYTSNVVEY